MLLEMPLNNIPLCRNLDKVLAPRTSNKEHVDERLLLDLASHMPTLMKLMSSSKDRAILIFLLSTLFSSTHLALTMGMQNQHTEKMKHTVEKFLNEADIKQKQTEEEAERQLESLIARLQIDIDRSDTELNVKRARLHDEEVETRNFDLKMKRKRLGRLQGKSKNDVKKRICRRLFHKWKKNLMSQKGKGKGCYKIDRRAEQAVFEVLQEQLKAHKRRWGEEGTGYLDHEQRIQSKEMLRIANRYLILN